jgi:hypothetical protein
MGGRWREGRGLALGVHKTEEHEQEEVEEKAEDFGPDDE